jgi:hypothetical protein
MTRADAPSAPAPTTAPRHSGHAHHHTHRHATSFATHLHHATAKKATDADLHTAMSKEGVPNTWEAGLRFIMERESGGQVGVSNHVDTARGLFQLTRASYHLNPNGAASFGNAVEEAQGGIRYIQQRYQTADNAAQFWQRHGWY